MTTSEAQAALEQAALEPVALEQAALEQAALEHAALKQAAGEPAAVEPAAVEPVALEHAALEQAALEQAALEPTAIGASDPALLLPSLKSPGDDLPEHIPSTAPNNQDILANPDTPLVEILDMDVLMDDAEGTASEQPLAPADLLVQQTPHRGSSPTERTPVQSPRQGRSPTQRTPAQSPREGNSPTQKQEGRRSPEFAASSNDSAIIVTGEEEQEGLQEQPEQPEHDNDPDGFSDYGSQDDTSSFYSSLRSGATDYYWENGRRYHAHEGGRYMLPNDETELDREDMKHHEWMLITECRLHLAPIGLYPQRILDIGTGTGIWAMQIAELYPSAEVIGTDISPVQPNWVPPNLTFEIDNLEAEWLFRPGSYDLINCRFMFVAIKDWSAMLAQAYRTLKPGGYIELTDLDLNPQASNPNVPQPSQLLTWLSIVGQGLARRGFNLRVACTFKDLLIEAGFVDVVETKFEVPWGPWPTEKTKKTIGFWHLEQFKQGLEGIAMVSLTRGMGWSASEVQVFLAGLRAELNNKTYHIMDHAYVAYGRKPLAGEASSAGF